MSIEKIVDSVIDNCIIECKKEKNIDRIQKELVDPIISHTFQKIYPYFLGCSIVFILILILAISILTLLIKKNFI